MWISSGIRKAGVESTATVHVFPTTTMRCRGAPGRPSPGAKENGHGLDLDEFPSAEGNRRLPIVGKSRARSVSGGLVGSHHRSRDPPATRHAVAVRRSPFADLGARRLGRSSTRTGPTSRHRLRLGRLPLCVGSGPILSSLLRLKSEQVFTGLSLPDDRLLRRAVCRSWCV